MDGLGVQDVLYLFILQYTVDGLSVQGALYFFNFVVYCGRFTEYTVFVYFAVHCGRAECTGCTGSQKCKPCLYLDLKTL